MLLLSFFIYLLLHYIVCGIFCCRIALPCITFGFMYFLYFTCFVILQFCWLYVGSWSFHIMLCHFKLRIFNFIILVFFKQYCYIVFLFMCSTYKLPFLYVFTMIIIMIFYSSLLCYVLFVLYYSKNKSISFYCVLYTVNIIYIIFNIWSIYILVKQLEWIFDNFSTYFARNGVCFDHPFALCAESFNFQRLRNLFFGEWKRMGNKTRISIQRCI